MDFAALPPEINSGLMYTGPGSGPMLAAAVAWDELSAELYSNASFYALLISDLTNGWLGPSSASMATAANPFVSWIITTAEQAERTGAQAKAAASAYEAAFVMTVPPPVIAANRALLLLLIATNFFGQNTPAIMATEVHYMEMWAQDAAAMLGYQVDAQAASTLKTFVPPAQTTNPAGLAAQATAVGQAAGTSAGTGAQAVAPLTSAVSTPMTSAVPTPLGSAVAAPYALADVTASTGSTTAFSSSTLPLSSVSSLSSSSTVLTSGVGLASGAGSSAPMGTSASTLLSSINGLMSSLSPAASTLGNQLQAFGSTLGGGFGSGTGVFGSVGTTNVAVTADVGRAASLGVLSVPQSWASAAPAFNQVSSILPGTIAAPAAVPGGPDGMLGGTPMPVNATRGMGAPTTLQPRFGFRPTVVHPPVHAG